MYPLPEPRPRPFEPWWGMHNKYKPPILEYTSPIKYTNRLTDWLTREGPAQNSKSSQAKKLQDNWLTDYITAWLNDWSTTQGWYGNTLHHAISKCFPFTKVSLFLVVGCLTEPNIHPDICLFPRTDCFIEILGNQVRLFKIIGIHNDFCLVIIGNKQNWLADSLTNLIKCINWWANICWPNLWFFWGLEWCVFQLSQNPSVWRYSGCLLFASCHDKRQLNYWNYSQTFVLL